MNHTISNEYLTATVNLKGAELCSLLSRQGHEYMWSGDPAVWGRHAPVLFPIVGKLNNNCYTYKGETYELPQHGFARDGHFEVIAHGAAHIRMALRHSEQTLLSYPFQFQLEIAYTLEGSQLAIEYVVKNLGEGDMYFSIGAHPAFALEGRRSQYSFVFSNEETAEKHVLNNGVFSGLTVPVLHETDRLPITDDLFEQDALVFKELRSHAIGLADESGQAFLTVHFEGFPYMGLWSKNSTAPFVCIEPWFGLADQVLHHGELSQKEGIQKIGEKESFACTHRIEISK